jgi:hypothetical protein
MVIRDMPVTWHRRLTPPRPMGVFGDKPARLRPYRVDSTFTRRRSFGVRRMTAAREGETTPRAAASLRLYKLFHHWPLVTMERPTPIRSIVGYAAS